jgi:hypothetical protein
VRRLCSKFIIFAVVSILSVWGCPCMRLDEDHKKYWYGNLISTSAREKK